MGLANSNQFEVADVADAAISDDDKKRLIAELQHGLPLVAHPYAEIGMRIGLTESQVLSAIAQLQQARIIKRFGVVVRHHELGYRANAMVVWDVPDHEVSAIARRITTSSFVTLCYQRSRKLPQWRYNLYCMIHGRARETVLENIDTLIVDCDLQNYAHEVLFSGRRFKQRGAVYHPTEGCDARFDMSDSK